MGEWAPEGGQKFSMRAGEDTPLSKSAYYMYALRGYVCTKPGGTAGVFALVPANGLQGWEFFYLYEACFGRFLIFSNHNS